MASTASQEKASRKYYATHKKYRENKIKETQREQKANKSEYNKEKREYYAKNEKYRKYKQKYAAEYRKREPIKSKAIKDRKATKAK